MSSTCQAYHHPVCQLGSLAHQATAHPSSLPFTGIDLALVAVIALILISIGGTLYHLSKI